MERFRRFEAEREELEGQLESAAFRHGLPFGPGRGERHPEHQRWLEEEEEAAEGGSDSPFQERRDAVNQKPALDQAHEAYLTLKVDEHGHNT